MGETREGEFEFLTVFLKFNLQILSNLQPEKGFVNIMDDVVIYSEPFGVVLVIGAWNYPLQLSMMPFAGAIAAGNCAILKPSELAVNCSKLMAQLIPKYLDNVSDFFGCFNGFMDFKILIFF